eukprot:Lankesteria_metandrocarpae@DN1065_c0_g1_i1.p1
MSMLNTTEQKQCEDEKEREAADVKKTSTSDDNSTTTTALFSPTSTNTTASGDEEVCGVDSQEYRESMLTTAATNLENAVPRDDNLLSKHADQLRKRTVDPQTLTKTEDAAEYRRSRLSRALQKSAGQRTVRTSRLDIDTNSDLANSPFWGFATVVCVSSSMFVLSQPFIRFLDDGRFIDGTLASAMFKDIWLLFFVSLADYLWSTTSYFLHLGYRNKYLGLKMLYFIQHTTQFVVLLAAVSACLYNRWAVIPSSFVLMQASIFFMKMHSYTATCLQLLRDEGTPAANPNYPHCLTFRNFIDYLFCPVLVYEPEYPRGSGFRLGYFTHKLFGLFFAMVFLYMVLTSFLVPITVQSTEVPFFETYCRLIVPCLIIDFLAFYIIFEAICNLFAEITNFGDREFYEDWWNSVNFDEYSRKWNRPVHEFLLRHVYLESLDKYSLSSSSAAFATFLFSAIMHELILAACLRVMRCFLIGLMMFQLPLIYIGKYIPSRTIGNVGFWIGISVGVPLLVTLYCRAWAFAHLNSTESIHIL